MHEWDQPVASASDDGEVRETSSNDGHAINQIAVPSVYCQQVLSMNIPGQDSGHQYQVQQSP